MEPISTEPRQPWAEFLAAHNDSPTWRTFMRRFGDPEDHSTWYRMWDIYLRNRMEPEEARWFSARAGVTPISLQVLLDILRENTPSERFGLL